LSEADGAQHDSPVTKPAPPARDPSAGAVRVAPPEPYRCRVRMKFTKQGAVRFLSHLDLLKCVERALRRAQIPVAYTEGFHPRIRISFGPALALGHASVCELMDIDMADDIDADDAARRLGAALPVGMEIRAAHLLERGARSLQASVERGRYHVAVEAPPDVSRDALAAAVAGFLELTEITLQKKTRTVNLRAFVHDLRVAEGESLALEMLLQMGQEGSVRPEDVVFALFGGAAGVAHAERVALQARIDGTLVEL